MAIHLPADAATFEGELPNRTTRDVDGVQLGLVLVALVVGARNGYNRRAPVRREFHASHANNLSQMFERQALCLDGDRDGAADRNRYGETTRDFRVTHSGDLRAMALADSVARSGSYDALDRSLGHPDASAETVPH
jgi:hypothetical protein